MLADFNPRGEVASKYGVFLAEAGTTDRATVIVDRDGIVRHASSVGPSGRRNVDDLLTLAREINGDRPFSAPTAPGKVSADATLYVREGCRFCLSVRRAIRNLKIDDAIAVRDVEKEPAARAELDALVGAGAKVPVLVQNGKAQQESADIIRHLAELYLLR